MTGELQPESSQPVSRYYVKSFGCQMNVYDSERMGDLLDAEGHVVTDSADNADIVVLNTCHIRERAAEKLYSDIGRLRKPRADGSRPVIVAAGCVAQAVRPTVKGTTASVPSVQRNGRRHRTVLLCVPR